MSKVLTASVHFNVAHLISLFLQHHTAGVFISGPFTTTRGNLPDPITGETDISASSRWCFCLNRGYEAQVSVAKEDGTTEYLNPDNELFTRVELVNQDEVWNILSSYIDEEDRQRYFDGYYSFNGAYISNSFESLIAKYWDKNTEFFEALESLMTTRLKLALSRPQTEAVDRGILHGAKIKYSVAASETLVRYETTLGSVINRDSHVIHWVMMYESAADLRFSVFNQFSTQGAGTMSLSSDRFHHGGSGDIFGLWSVSTVNQIPGSGQSKTIVETVRAVMEEMR